MPRQYFRHAKLISATASAAFVAFATLITLSSTTAFAADDLKGTPEENAFHAVMAPLWHAPVGKTRIPNACAKAANMVKLANQIKNSNAASLKEATGIFKDKCQAKPSNPAEAEAAFIQIHDAYHKIIEAQ